MTHFSLSHKSFVEQNYNFFLFSMLTVDLLLKPNKLNIPYDTLLDVVYEHYNQLPEFDEALHEAPYSQFEDYICNSSPYMDALKSVAE